MTDDEIRIQELSLQGFGCSQILALLSLEATGEENPGLVRAVSGLHGGLGFTGKLCGALAGGCCVLALRGGGRGAPAEMEDGRLQPMIRTLVEWFEAEFGPRYGGIDCARITEGNPANRLVRCPELVSAVHAKVREILESQEGGVP
jgi:hypothetical protein